MELSGRSVAPSETTTEFKPHAADSIKRLAELRDQGLISAEEYEEKRKKLLDEI